jgi:glycopeptide antibiotics resistance protein
LIGTYLWEVNNLIQGICLDKGLLFVSGSAVWVLARGIDFVKKKKKVKINLVREIALGILGLYLSGLAGITLFPIDINWGDRVFLPASTYINYIPAVSIIRSISLLKNSSFSIGFELKLLIMNVGGNLFLLTPLSVILPIIWNKCRPFKWCFLFCFLTSFLIEILQLVENILGVARGRICDIDDLILNSIGSIIGYLIYKYINGKFGDLRRKYRSISGFPG